MAEELDVDAMIERFRERAAAVRQRNLPPVGGDERTAFIQQAQVDFQDYAMLGDATAAIEDAIVDGNQAVAFQRQHRAAQRGAIHDQLAGERVDRHRPESVQLREDRKLGRAQARRRQVLVVKLGHMPSGLAQCQAVALR